MTDFLHASSCINIINLFRSLEFSDVELASSVTILLSDFLPRLPPSQFAFVTGLVLESWLTGLMRDLAFDTTQEQPLPLESMCPSGAISWNAVDYLVF
jgi:hypothetical protein